ncbi:hypothetical protein [Humisphaera borealis]|uniref:Uncharacterized protein n=1 Tax=Humisphaera borealis TaxID=2807512 RepID=A0A7M2WYZ6_9BACT|nr:hypothetical protein [Humisphaera borealis]QOV90747.1 hypothetical protein IPV69_05145 [Humisphaera borealis]
MRQIARLGTSIVLITTITVAVGDFVMAWAQTPATKPAGAIDFNRARVLLRKSEQGEKLTPEEQAYLDRAREARRQSQQPAARANVSPRESTGLVPLPELVGTQRYNGFEGGLYGHGMNEPPAAHAKLALAAAAQIRPLDVDGKPDAKVGRVVLMSIGMSNTTQEFSRFKELADGDKDVSPSLTIVDAAQGGRAADDWTDAKMPTYDEAARRLSAAKVSANQVQAVWIKQARKGPGTLGAFPQHAKVLQDDLENILRAARKRYPNLKLAFLSSRIYAGYAKSALNPEPFAYEGAFSVQWAIAKQAVGDPELNCDPGKGEVIAPVAVWGAYLWADGTKGRKADGLIYQADDLGPDGTHPSNNGRQKVAETLLKFFKSDTYCKNWFLRNG